MSPKKHQTNKTHPHTTHKKTNIKQIQKAEPHLKRDISARWREKYREALQRKFRMVGHKIRARVDGWE